MTPLALMLAQHLTGDLASLIAKEIEDLGLRVYRLEKHTKVNDVEDHTSDPPAGGNT